MSAARRLTVATLCVLVGGLVFSSASALASEPPEAPAPGSAPSEHCENEKLRAEQPYGLELPDCRAYEMVSPLETDGNDATEPNALVGAGLARASEAKGKEPAITYAARGAFAGPVGAELRDQFLSHREPEHGRWSTLSITPPAEEADLGLAYNGGFFTPELTEGLTSALANLADETIPGLSLLYLANFEAGSYQLISHLEKPYAKPYQLLGEVAALGASTDLSHVAFTAYGEGANFYPLYEFADGQVVQASVSNGGEPWEVTAGWRAMSADGLRVVFIHSGELYMRQSGEQKQSPMNSKEECEDLGEACTIRLSAGQAQYWGANTEDTEVFYTEGGKLFGFNIGRYEESIKNKLPEAEALEEAREDIAGDGFAHENAAVQGVVQVSEDGSYVYFVADGALAEHATAQTCIGSGPGEGCNLYMDHYEHDVWTTTFIATLAANDANDWSEGPQRNSAVISPNGVLMAFTSEQSLTGYDNQPAETGDGECEGESVADSGEIEYGKCHELYLYDSETGGLTCASCNPSGSRPIGGAILGIGAKSEGGAGVPDYRPRALLEGGALFFDSSDALVPHASDGRQNVYEYEDGYVYAISNVAGGQESFFLDSSPDGRNVFFASADRLLPEDTGNNVVVWDAREDGGFPVRVVPAACTNADSCKPPVSAQPSVFAPTGSATFNGLGNLPPAPPAAVKTKAKSLTYAQKLANALRVCKKRPKKRRASCEKQARQKDGAARAKKAGDKRRASR